MQQQDLQARLPALIQRIGGEGFVDTCLTTLNAVLKVDHLGLFSFDEKLKPRLIDGASLGKENLTINLAKKYIQYFYLSDPNRAVIEKMTTTREEPLLLGLKATEITDQFYRQQIYEKHDLIERLSWLGQISNTWYAANMYREKASGHFNSDEINTLKTISPTIIAAIERHLSLISPDTWEVAGRPSTERLETILNEINEKLTNRERQVCARALLGMTHKGIGLDLEIQPTTVKTLTQRAYKKLNISTLNELFALCLRALALRAYTASSRKDTDLG